VNYTAPFPQPLSAEELENVLKVQCNLTTFPTLPGVSEATLKELTECVFLLTTARGYGTAFSYGGGYILTNSHVCSASDVPFATIWYKKGGSYAHCSLKDCLLYAFRLPEHDSLGVPDLSILRIPNFKGNINSNTSLNANPLKEPLFSVNFGGNTLRVPFTVKCTTGNFLHSNFSHSCPIFRGASGSPIYAIMAGGAIRLAGMSFGGSLNEKGDLNFSVCIPFAGGLVSLLTKFLASNAGFDDYFRTFTRDGERQIPNTWSLPHASPKGSFETLFPRLLQDCLKEGESMLQLVADGFGADIDYHVAGKDRSVNPKGRDPVGNPWFLPDLRSDLSLVRFDAAWERISWKVYAEKLKTHELFDIYGKYQEMHAKGRIGMTAGNLLGAHDVDRKDFAFFRRFFVAAKFPPHNRDLPLTLHKMVADSWSQFHISELNPKYGYTHVGILSACVVFRRGTHFYFSGAYANQHFPSTGKDKEKFNFPGDLAKDDGGWHSEKLYCHYLMLFAIWLMDHVHQLPKYIKLRIVQQANPCLGCNKTFITFFKDVKALFGDECRVSINILYHHENPMDLREILAYDANELK